MFPFFIDGTMIRDQQEGRHKKPIDIAEEGVARLASIIIIIIALHY